MHARRFILSATLAAALTGGVAYAQEGAGARNLLAGGGFEDDPVSLRLPEISPFPLVVGGWGLRADGTDAAVSAAVARFDRQAIAIRSSQDAPAYLIQDAPLATAGYVFRSSFRRERGSQVITLLGAWDRMEPTAAALLRVELRGRALVVSTPAGEWRLDAPLAGAGWHDLEIRADPRTDQILIRVDGSLAATVPGATAEAPRTVLLGGHASGARSSFLYDGLELLRLPEIEIAAVAGRLPPEHPAGRRLAAATAALETGSGRMVAAELRAAARLAEVGAVDAEIAARIQALIALVSAR